MNGYIKAFLIFPSLFLVGCETLPQKSEDCMESQKNACLPTAIAFKQGLRKQDAWARVVRYTWHDKRKQKVNRHAIVAYLYPPGENILWTYDIRGSYRVQAHIDDPVQIARAAVAARQEDRDVSFAEFLH